MSNLALGRLLDCGYSFGAVDVGRIDVDSENRPNWRNDNLQIQA